MTEPLRSVVVRLPEHLYEILRTQAEKNDRPIAVELRRIAREALVG